MVRWMRWIMTALLVVGVAHTSVVWAEIGCKTVVSTEFIGQVCSDTFSERRTGRWIIGDSGMLDGSATIMGDPALSLLMIKSGTLRTDDFLGSMSRIERRSMSASFPPMPVKESTETLKGVWTLAPDEKLIGTWTMNERTDGTVAVTDQRIRGEVLLGSLLYPNPASNSTRVDYGTATGGLVRLQAEVFDGLLMRRVSGPMDLVNSQQAPGIYTATLTTTNLASGVYKVKLQLWINGVLKIERMLSLTVRR